MRRGESEELQCTEQKYIYIDILVSAICGIITNFYWMIFTLMFRGWSARFEVSKFRNRGLPGFEESPRRRSCSGMSLGSFLFVILVVSLGRCGSKRLCDPPRTCIRTTFRSMTIIEFAAMTHAHLEHNVLSSLNILVSRSSTDDPLVWLSNINETRVTSISYFIYVPRIQY